MNPEKISFSQRQFPCGLTRREALWQMGGGFAGVALTAMLERDGFFQKIGYADEGVVNPLAPKPSHFPTKVKNCIFLLMNGGPSQVDTFDPKPLLEKYAGKPMPSDKKYINSGGRAVGFLTPAARKFADASDFAEVTDIVMGRCSMCHAAEPGYDGIHWAPKGIRLETPEEIANMAREIYVQAGLSHAMPPANVSYIEPEERAKIVAWYRGAAG